MRAVPHHPRGFTIAELTVSVAVTAIVMTLVLGTVISQQRGFQASELGRTAIESGRDAVLEVERTLRTAGFGVDPRFAFDFGYYRCKWVDNVAPAPLGEKVCRDRAKWTGNIASAGFSDELVFLKRNTSYRFDLNGTNGCATAPDCPVGNVWKIKPGTIDSISKALTLEKVTAGKRFYRGQVLLAVCRNAPSRYTMLTVNEPVVGAGGDLVIHPYPQFTPTAPPLLPASPYRENAIFDVAAPGCYNSGNGFVFQIDLYRYFIRYDRTTGDKHPWLMVDRGLNYKDTDTSDPWLRNGTDDPDAAREDYFEPVAPNIDDMQIAYLLEPRTSIAAPDIPGPGGNSNWALGDANADPAANSGSPYSLEEPSLLVPAPIYASTVSDVKRANRNPANIRSVRVSFIVRSAQAAARLQGGTQVDLARTNDAQRPLDALVPLENRALIKPDDGIPRAVLRSSITVRNMPSRGMFFH